jgi:glycine betaine/proline transport system substrate-binding protein
MFRKKNLLLAILAIIALLAASCGDDDSASATGGDGDLPGAGVSVTMARADWSSGYVQAEIYRQILTEVGYEVADPADLELGPSNAYTAMAQGEFDLWTNSWYPGHLSWHQNELTDGTTVGEHLTIADGLFSGAGVQGFLITKSVAEEHGITSLDQVNSDPDLVALFDSDGNGKANIYGCQESYTCDDIITNQIAFYGWDNIEQNIASYDALFADASGLVNEEKPAIIYTWTPSSYVTTLVPGGNVLWLSAHPTDVIDDSNPSGTEGGEFHDQRPGFDKFGAESCTQPCQLGWIPADIQVTANTEFLDANPFLQALLPKILPSVIDISIIQVEQADGDGSQEDVVRLATAWMTEHRAEVDGWIAAAKAEVA